MFRLYIMSWWFYVIIFFVILFSYIHIQHQWKTGEDLEIYEYDYVSHKNLQDICQWKQPVIFEIEFPKNHNEPLETIQIKDVRDSQTCEETFVETISLSYSSGRGLIDTDTKSVFYSYRNNSQIKEDPLWTDWFKTWDPYLKPPFCVYQEYDVLYGSKKTCTTTQFHHESHTFLYLPPETNKTAVRIKMTPYKSRHFLNPINDYIMYEFWSKINLFAQHDKIRCLDFLVKPGYVLFIPSFWFYSIEFQDKDNEVCIVKYTTCANMAANTKHIMMYHMQQQNIQEKWWKPLQDTEFDILPVKPDDNEDTVIDVSNNVVAEEKNVVEELIDELKPKSM